MADIKLCIDCQSFIPKTWPEGKVTEDKCEVSKTLDLVRGEELLPCSIMRSSAYVTCCGPDGILWVKAAAEKQKLVKR